MTISSEHVVNYYYQPDESIPAFLNKRPGKDAGYDVYASKSQWAMPFQTIDVSVNLHIHTPAGHCALVCSRSGNASRSWLTHIGVGDNGYSGQYTATITNLFPLPRRIKKGERVAQIVFVPFRTLKNLIKVPNQKEFDDIVCNLSNSDRGHNSHNSSGR